MKVHAQYLPDLENKDLPRPGKIKKKRIRVFHKISSTHYMKHTVNLIWKKKESRLLNPISSAVGRSLGSNARRRSSSRRAKGSRPGNF